jgi:hypothetical protein
MAACDQSLSESILESKRVIFKVPYLTKLYAIKKKNTKAAKMFNIKAEARARDVIRIYGSAEPETIEIFVSATLFERLPFGAFLQILYKRQFRILEIISTCFRCKKNS